MKTILYFFTGTGNSLAVAKKIASGLDDAILVSITSMMDSSGDIVPQADRVGIICPVYFTGLPDMVASFAKRLDLSRVSYLFGVLTHGGGGGGAALAQLDTILRSRSGTGLSAGYDVNMPGNYILMYESPSGDRLSNLLTSADKIISKLTTDIAACRHHPVPLSLVSRLLHALIYPWFIAHVHEKDRKFSVSDACTSCGICAGICPAHNIEMVGNRPVWNHHCQLCCGCIHLCPAEAIQAGKRTAGRKRYRNPEIDLSELQIRKP